MHAGILGGKALSFAILVAAEQEADQGEGAAEEQEVDEGVGAVAAEVLEQAGGVVGGDAVQEAPGEVDEEGGGGPEEGFAGGEEGNGDGKDCPANEEAEEGAGGVGAGGEGLVPEGVDEGFPVEQEAEQAAAEEGEPAGPGPAGGFVRAARGGGDVHSVLFTDEDLLGGGKSNGLGSAGEEVGVDFFEAENVAVPGEVFPDVVVEVLRGEGVTPGAV